MTSFGFTKMSLQIPEKRVGHAAMVYFLYMNDCILESTDDEQESIILQVAAGQMDKETFTEWVKSKIKPL